ncbi:hypothetical protein AADZ90_001740 [Aestuariibius sp. 2305UL40-4]|uniref:hypothetical protein n=1 Tax=Aestuariibius violaceus TaxID=3234132 RepID=UPI00345EC868
MTGSLEIAPHIHDTVFVFALNLPSEDVPTFTEGNQKNWPLKDALGATTLDPNGVDIVALKEIAGLELSGLLIEGHGAEAAQVLTDKARLDALEGHVVLVHATAFQGVAQNLNPGPELTFIGRYSGPRTATPVEPLRSDAAEGTLKGDASARSHGKIGGRVATFALLVLFLLVGLMVWVAQ